MEFIIIGFIVVLYFVIKAIVDVTTDKQSQQLKVKRQEKESEQKQLEINARQKKTKCPNCGATYFYTDLEKCPYCEK